jgi:hypothetical protein
MRRRSSTALLGALVCALSAATSSCSDDGAAKPQPPPALSLAATASAVPRDPAQGLEAKIESRLLATAGCPEASLDEAALPRIEIVDELRCPAELEFERQARDLPVGDEPSTARHAPAPRACARPPLTGAGAFARGRR